MILTQKQQKQQHYHQHYCKYDYQTGEEILPSNRKQILEENKFIYFPLGKALEKQTQIQVDHFKFLNLSNKTNELKQIEGIFPKNLMNDFIIHKLKDVIKLHDIIKTELFQ